MYVRRIIISLSLFMAVMLQWIGNATANPIPKLQLYIPGASYTYDPGTGEGTGWAYDGNSFDLQVISAKKDHTVSVSMALIGIEEGADLSSVSINFGSETYTGDDFTWGTPDRLSGGHGVFDAYYVEIPVGDFGDVAGVVCNMEPGNEGDCDDYGEIKTFSVTVSGATGVHFDAYTATGKKVSAPFSHDAAAMGTGAPVPEPATVALLSIGIVSLLGYKGRKFLMKS